MARRFAAPKFFDRRHQSSVARPAASVVDRAHELILQDLARPREDILIYTTKTAGERRLVLLDHSRVREGH